MVHIWRSVKHNLIKHFKLHSFARQDCNRTIQVFWTIIVLWPFAILFENAVKKKLVSYDAVCFGNQNRKLFFHRTRMFSNVLDTISSWKRIWISTSLSSVSKVSSRYGKCFDTDDTIHYLISRFITKLLTSDEGQCRLRICILNTLFLGGKCLTFTRATS
jgi:hypothetical protein